MAITLKPETEARLRERAEREGQDVSTFAEALLADALADDPDDLTPEDIAQIREGIRRGYQAGLEGRERSLDAYAAQVQQRRTARGGEVPERV